MPLRVEHLDRHAQPAGLQLATPDRGRGIAEREAGDDVGAAADARQVQVALDAPVDVVVAVRGKRTPGGEDGPERGQVVRPLRREPLLLRQREILGARAEDGHPLLRGHVP